MFSFSPQIHFELFFSFAVKYEGILYYKSRLLECAELKAVGHLANSINIENFTGVNFRVPLVDQHSPLGLSIALYILV